MLLEYISTDEYSEKTRRFLAKDLKILKRCSNCSLDAFPKSIIPERGTDRLVITWLGSSLTDICCSKSCVSTITNMMIKLRDPNSYKDRGVKSGNTQRGKTYEDMYSKEESNKRKENLSIKFSENNPRWSTKYRTPLEIEKQKELNRHASNNPFSIEGARKNYDDRYGVEKSNKIKKILSISRVGENNPMYGKQVPMYSGAGTKGYYNEFFFRSLIECAFIHKCDNEGVDIINAETKDFWVDYEINGVKRIYRPDFYLKDSDTIIEIKHSRFISTKENQLKFAAAKSKFSNFIVLTEKEIPYIKRSKFNELLINECIKLIIK
jgi:hypothetical protein